MKAIEFCIHSEARAGVLSLLERKPPEIHEQEQV